MKEVKAGYECGFVFENFNDIKEGRPGRGIIRWWRYLVRIGRQEGKENEKKQY